MKINCGLALSASLILLFFVNPVFATVYSISEPDQAIIGQIQQKPINSEETLGHFSQRYDMGYNEIEKANPNKDLSKPLRKGELLKIPSQHLLPNQTREGIVVNLPEMRMYYFIPQTNKVITHPIGIGKIGKTIPITKGLVTKKTENPTWVPPDDIREFNLTQGIVLPQIMPPGPDNPLGPYAIYLSIPTFLIHSTIFPESIGKRASFGCIRMYENDMKSFFSNIEIDIPVVIVNSPIKVAWQKQKLYMEAFPSLEEHHQAFDASLPGTVSQIQALSRNEDVLVDWQAIAFIETERDGLPHDIGIKL